ncbi:hypothetical protein UA08_03849 [Talaromyces atroroseus]|uniref:DUF8035 domain-containing protein n=1 Tax=Talaromyces atroroseus TaxID=1441469 RepID=A0A225AVA8_TALAT|nr:hypothetical protein UA08_03849 [Talaromyces atroroseus]OKL61238.1 hypothetical protein UA08_03849 [Talaromyces atroroseus]
MPSHSDLVHAASDTACSTCKGTKAFADMQSARLPVTGLVRFAITVDDRNDHANDIVYAYPGQEPTIGEEPPWASPSGILCQKELEATSSNLSIRGYDGPKDAHVHLAKSVGAYVLAPSLSLSNHAGLEGRELELVPYCRLPSLSVKLRVHLGFLHKSKWDFNKASNISLQAYFSRRLLVLDVVNRTIGNVNASSLVSLRKLLLKAWVQHDLNAEQDMPHKRDRKKIAMPRQDHPDEVYEDDSFYEEVDRRRRSRDDRYFDPEFGPRRHFVARSPPPVREIDERVVRRHQRDRSAPGFIREDVLPTRYRDRDRQDDLSLERETEEVYGRRRTSPPRFRPRRVSRGEEDVVSAEVDDRRRRPREKEKVVFEERRVSSPPPREEIERDEVVFRKRDRSLPPRRAKKDEDIFIERDRKRYETSDSEIEEDEEAIVRRHHRPSRREDRENVVERQRLRVRRHSLPPLDDPRGNMEDEEDEVIIRHRDRSSNRRRRERLLPREEQREEEIIFEERERSPHRRSRREEFVVRHEDESPPRRRRDDEVDDVVIRRRSRSIPSRKEEQDEIISRDQRRPSPRKEDDREEIVIRHHDRSAPVREDDREEVRIRARHRSSRARDEDQDDTVLRRRSAAWIDVDGEEFLVRRDKHGRRLSLGTKIEEDEIILRDGGGPREDEIESRHVPSPRHSPVRSHSRHAEEKEEIIIRQEDRGGRDDVNREIVIRRDEERSPSPESSEPSVIRKPPIVQELITHHRHIDTKGYETIPPLQQRNLEEPSVTEEIEIKPRGHAEEIIFEHQDKARSMSPPHRRHSLPEEEDKELIIKQSIPGGHGREREIIIREEERERKRELIPKEAHVGRRYTGVRDKRDRRWTEIAKDLVVREAIERMGYEFEESDHFYYVFEYLRYDDVERLVHLSGDIRRFRRERIRDIRREREMLPRPPPPLRLERAPPREPRLWEPRERFRERDVIIEEGQRPRRRYREI